MSWQDLSSTRAPSISLGEPDQQPFLARNFWIPCLLSSAQLHQPAMLCLTLQQLPLLLCPPAASTAPGTSQEHCLRRVLTMGKHSDSAAWSGILDAQGTQASTHRWQQRHLREPSTPVCVCVQVPVPLSSRVKRRCRHPSSGQLEAMAGLLWAYR